MPEFSKYWVNIYMEEHFFTHFEETAVYPNLLIGGTEGGEGGTNREKMNGGGGRAG